MGKNIISRLTMFHNDTAEHRKKTSIKCITENVLYWHRGHSSKGGHILPNLAVAPSQILTTILVSKAQKLSRSLLRRIYTLYKKTWLKSHVRSV